MIPDKSTAVILILNGEGGGASWWSVPAQYTNHREVQPEKAAKAVVEFKKLRRKFSAVKS